MIFRPKLLALVKAAFSPDSPAAECLSNQYIFRDIADAMLDYSIVFSAGSIHGDGQILSYSVRTDSWLPEISTPGHVIGYSTVLTGDGRTFVIGGSVYKSNFEGMTVTEPTDRVFSRIDGADWEKMPSLSFARVEFATAIFDDKIFVIGGIGKYGPVDEIEVFSLKERKWSIFQTKLPTKRWNAAYAVVGKEVFVLGGYVSGVDKRLDSECINLETGKFYPMPPLKGRRDIPATVVVGNRFIWMFGGYTTDVPGSSAWLWDNSVEVFDTQNYTFSYPRVCLTGNSHPWISAVVLGEYIMIFGSKTIPVILDTKTLTWHDSNLILPHDIHNIMCTLSCC